MKDLGTAKLEDGLPPLKIATTEGIIEVPCKFRRGGLAVGEFGDVLNVTHESSGMKIPGTTEEDKAVVLAKAMMLLSLGIDWTQDAKTVAAAIHRNRHATNVCQALKRGSVIPINLGEIKAKA